MLKFVQQAVYNFFLIATFALVYSCYSSALGQSLGKPLVLPVKYDEHRFYVQPITEDGTTLNFFTDTGGGLFIFSDVAERLKLPLLKPEMEGAPNTVMLPKFKSNAAIPLPLGSSEQLSVAPINIRNQMNLDWSGMLGQQWFAGRVWTFDYPNKRLLLRVAGDLPKTDPEYKIALGFKTNASGQRSINFPRIAVTIAGENFDLLFDTGATTDLSEAALQFLKDNRSAIRATSFITASVFERWRREHPNWRVIVNAENKTKATMIEVPEIKIGRYRTGAVWFTVRPDKNFHEYMSQWMDKKIDGALGGNALRHFRVTVDYPNAIAIFEK